MTKKESKKNIEALTHDKARRKHIPTAEYQSVMQKEKSSRSASPMGAVPPGW